MQARARHEEPGTGQEELLVLIILGLSMSWVWLSDWGKENGRFSEWRTRVLGPNHWLV